MSDLTLPESLWCRPVPERPYRLSGSTLRIPAFALELSLALFREYAARQVEACCFWYGTGDAAGNGHVRAVVVPRQINSRGHYSVSADAMAAVSATTRPHGWRNLAQLHTHPGRGVEHSLYDDSHANSRRALSLVVPHYGRWQDKWPAGIGVHEFRDGDWHLLDRTAAARRTVLEVTTELVLRVDLR